MDGELLTSRDDGRALSVDPGLHEFSFGTDSGSLTAVKVMIVQGEHNRPISVSIRSSNAVRPAPVVTPPSFDPSPASVPVVGSATRGLSVFPFALGGLVGAGVSAGLYAAGNKNFSSLATDLTIGVSAAAVVVAGWLFATPRARQETAPQTAVYLVDVHPTRSGAFASLARTF